MFGFLPDRRLRDLHEELQQGAGRVAGQGGGHCILRENSQGQLAALYYLNVFYLRQYCLEAFELMTRQSNKFLPDFKFFNAMR